MSEKLKKELLQDIALLKQRASISTSLAEVCELYGYSNHGRNTSTVRECLNSEGIQYSHFTTGGKKSVLGERICPNCNNKFTVILSNIKESQKVTCGHACANKYFSWNQGSKNKKSGISYYRKLLISFYEEHGLLFKCCHCSEADPIVVDIHHIDEDRYNNDLTNLIPLCVRCHRLLHSNKEINMAIFNSMVLELDKRDPSAKIQT